MQDGNTLIDAHCYIGAGFHYGQTPEALLAQMAQLGIDRAVLAPADRYIAVDNREGNDLVLKAVARWPDHFWGFATVNPWYGQRAVQEFKRAIRAGLIGLNLDSVLQGYLICDPLVHPLVEAAIELDVPIYFSTGTPINAQPMQLVELALAYPEGRFIMGHMGHADFWIDVPYALAQAPNIWAELSYNLPSAVKRMLDAGFGERLIFGSDAPKSNLALEVMKIGYWDATAARKADILAGNLRRLLGQRPLSKTSALSDLRESGETRAAAFDQDRSER
ncbi:MAG: amidohydrolase [Chloroflexi bacterium HGW-Chloroflexi-1]|nr:MAG: amidohydrolase [Chloroflexi bacterium HGW-Chloroflexi-1]